MLLQRIGAAAIALAACLVHAQPGPIQLRTVASRFANPLEVTHAGDGSGRLFVVEQGGRVRIVRNGQTLATPFLDISGITAAGGEQGLLGLAFHPRYAQNGRFYVFYNVNPGVANGSHIVISRFTRSAGNPDVADPASLSEVIRIPHLEFSNHNGGKIAFGPDGYLYAGIGDGGGGNDPNDQAQNLGTLLGKIIRLDVDSAAPYAIPTTNPFRGTPGARPEIFAFGLRNPFRFNFDRQTGDLFIGDVGQGAREEIDFIAAGSSGGQNFGWRVFEGTRCNIPATNCSVPGHVPPIIEYAHDSQGGFSVTGGVRYRGRALSELRGYYIYGDYGSGRIWAAAPNGSGTWVPTVVGSLVGVASFGQDESGELYATDHTNGILYRVAVPDTDGDGMSDAYELARFGSTTGGDPNADTDGDGLRNLDEYREGRNATVKDNDVFTDSRLFALQQYRDFLARDGDDAGVAFWSARIDAGQPRYNVIENFISAPEFQGFIAPVTRLYFAYFLRIPDYPGLTFWIGQYRGGASLDAVSDAFAGSPEFSQMYGGLDNGQFVDRVYQNVLGRAADPSGRAFWTGELDSGRRTRGQVMAGFSESPEFTAAMANEVFVTMVYVGMLRRSPDPAGFQFWVGSMDQGRSGGGLVDGFLRSGEYRQRFLP